MASASVSVIIFCFANIAEWAIDPAISCTAILLSKSIDALIDSIMASGPLAKRPPHIAFDEFLSDI